jgi:SAM-dependent methyltransferase
MIRTIVRAYSQRSRKKRGDIFLEYLNPSKEDKILDLGSEEGSLIASIIPFRENIYLADIDKELLQIGEKKYGFHTILLDESGTVPYSDEYFDIVFCSSVIEHVTVTKKEAILIQSGKKFREAAWIRQKEFAQEIRRIGRRYFVQTPNKYFPIESHTWLPVFFVWIPRYFQVRLIKFLNTWWPKKTEPDWNLLTPKEMRALFPDAEIVLEKSCGITKSIMAIRR